MATKKYKIVLIGAGNVATHLGGALQKANYTIVQVVSLHTTSAEELANKLKCKFANSLNKIDTSADMYIIAVNDDAISKVVKQLKIKNKIVLHTSGSVDMETLHKTSNNYGVLYPVQTLTKEKEISFIHFPLCIEASDKKTFKIIESLAKSISNDVQKVNSAQRKQLHLAAVFANNFTNHLFTIAENILEKNKLSFDLLKFLIVETVSKMNNNSPSEIQTGPAKRSDKKTMETHLKLLAGNKDYQNTYKLLSKGIIKSAKKNK